MQRDALIRSDCMLATLGSVECAAYASSTCVDALVVRTDASISTSAGGAAGGGGPACVGLLMHFSSVLRETTTVTLFPATRVSHEYLPAASTDTTRHANRLRPSRCPPTTRPEA
eukprot:4372522-Prymnesium_polylepis.2